MTTTAGAVAAQAARLGRDLTEPQAQGLAGYLNLLIAWNARMNLVGIRDWQSILADLVADSWHLADILADLLAEQSLPENPRILDLGAGAGLPGIPLRMFWSAGDYLMVEPRQKRAIFLQTAIANLDLKRTRVFAGRTEELPEAEHDADLVLGRAFLPWREFLGLARTLIKPTGRALVFANAETPTDVPDGWSLECARDYSSSAGSRSFWVFMPASAAK